MRARILAAAFVVAAALAWWLWPAVRPASAGTHEGATAEAAAEAVTAPLDGRAPRAAAVTERTATCLLRVVDHDGNPLRGRLCWRSDGAVPLDLDLAESNETAIDGGTRLVVPAETWVGLRVDVDGGGCAERLLEPFAGERSETIVVDLAAAALRVLVVDHALRHPLGERVVVVSRPGELVHEAPTEAARATTAADGRVAFAGLGPGPVDVALEGRQARRVSLARGETAACLLVAPEPTVTLRLAVQCGDIVHTRDRPHLVLLRRDDGSGDAVPVPHELAAGRFEAEVAVAPGAYELVTFPLEHFDVAGVEPRLVVAAEPAVQERAVTLAERTADAEIVLTGVGERDLPLTVFPRREGDVLPAHTPHPFFGPWRWRTLTQRLPSVPGAVRLVAVRRSEHWLAAAPVELTPGRHEIAMRPATLLLIRWPGGHGLDRAPVAFVTHADAETAVFLRRGVIADGDGPAARGWLAEVVVPRGELAIECATESGATLWRDRLVATRLAEKVAPPAEPR